jgi:hypothetical protein
MTAQIAGFSISSNQQLIEDAVKDGLFVLHQYYRLQDTTAATPSFYGWGDLPHFGDTYSLAVKTVGGYFSGNQTIHPWMYDSKFEEYRDSRQYAPVISTTEYKLTDSVAYSPLAFKNIAFTSVSDNRVYRMQDTATFSGKGLCPDYTVGEKKGWLVWAVSDKPLSESNTQKLSLMIYRSELVFDAGKELYEVKNPSTEKIVLGGIYILPEITGIGQVTFKLLGFLHNENNKWNVVKLKDPSSASGAPGNTPAVGTGGLTRVVDTETTATAGDGDNSSKKKKSKKNKK